MAEGDEVESPLSGFAQAGDSREYCIADGRRNLAGAAFDDLADEERVPACHSVESLAVSIVVGGDPTDRLRGQRLQRHASHARAARDSPSTVRSG